MQCGRFSLIFIFIDAMTLFMYPRVGNPRYAGYYYNLGSYIILHAYFHHSFSQGFGIMWPITATGCTMHAGLHIVPLHLISR